jgi:hypothetical protein
MIRRLVVPLLPAIALVLSLAPSTGGPAPAKLLAVATGNAERPCGALLWIDALSGAVEAEKAIHGAVAERVPTDVVILRDRRRALVAQVRDGASNDPWIDLQTVTLPGGKVLSSVHVDGWLDALELHPTNGDLWGFHVDDQNRWRLVRVDPSSGALAEVGLVTVWPRSLAFTEQGELWSATAATASAPAQIVRFDPATAAVLAQHAWPLAGDPQALEIGRDGKLLALAEDGRLYRVDPQTGATTALWPPGAALSHVVVGLETAR